MKTISSILTILLFTLLVSTAEAKVAVIANKNIKASSIDQKTLSNIFSLKSKQFGGMKVVLFDLSSDNAVKSSFYNFLGISFSKMKKVWLKAKLTGNGNPPTSTNSDDETLSKVASTPGAIGYVDASKVNDSVIVLYTIE